MADKARHGFGSTTNVSAAIEAGTINEFDILFLDGDTDPKVGWIDKNGVFRLATGEKNVVRVDELPTADGDENVVYIYNNEAYIWDGSQCVPVSKSADLTELEGQVAELETQVETKVTAEEVQTMIEEYNDGVVEVVEF